MNAGLTTTRVVWRSLIAASVVLALVITVGATTTTAASPAACRVRNAITGKTYEALQAAVDAAKPGARLVVRGMCRGTTVIDKDLVIAGIQTESSGKPTLSGGQVQNKTGGSRPPPGGDPDSRDLADERGRHFRVVEIERGARVKLRALLITRGLAVRGGGIRNRGDLTLRDVVVRGNSNDPYEWSGWGPGVYNEGRLRLNGATRIVRNYGVAGTCAVVFNRGTLVMNGSSSIESVCSAISERHTALTMNGSSSLRGGRLWNFGGRVTMNDASWVRPYDSGDYGDGGPGVVNLGTFTMNDASSIRDGFRETTGVWNASDRAHATFTMNDTSSISGNPGGGLDNWPGGIVRMNDASSIHDNIRHCVGGGVAMWGGTLRISGSSSITANTVIDHDIDDDSQCSGLRGAGLYQSNGTTLLAVICGPGGNVYGNTPDDCHFEP